MTPGDAWAGVMSKNMQKSDGIRVASSDAGSGLKPGAPIHGFRNCVPDAGSSVNRRLDTVLDIEPLNNHSASPAIHPIVLRPLPV